MSGTPEQCLARLTPLEAAALVAALHASAAVLGPDAAALGARIRDGIVASKRTGGTEPAFALSSDRDNFLMRAALAIMLTAAAIAGVRKPEHIAVEELARKVDIDDGELAVGRWLLAVATGTEETELQA